ncbi:hypothetical protein DERF_004663 [Dermatophagoides farinae]|uniref:Uncharacterized protein n=1 Tax=Dermatophagoides farinae TaxID=6954 RepID=A0A922L6F2_DERFA|nr:hypothetical protein DERF_004663 [Dermatophagoides farinae]
MSNKNGEKRKTLGQCGYRKNDEFYLQKENPKSRMIARLLLNFGEANGLLFNLGPVYGLNNQGKVFTTRSHRVIFNVRDARYGCEN